MDVGKAGAGLPAAERLFIRYFMLPLVRLLFTWKLPMWLLKREVNKIGVLVDGLSPQQLESRVLIDKVFAIEEHSRNFSVNMVLEHLVIAGHGVTAIIESLSHEQPFEPEITIEGVKPTGTMEAPFTAFTAFMKQYEKRIDALPEKHSKMTKTHPWFVAFNNFDWRAFMYLHTFIHRRQIEAIIASLKE